ncbi:MAG: hypothetical protein ACTSQE_11165 [Candidatus Heimdallarchaeaceae archaeon]
MKNKTVIRTLRSTIWNITKTIFSLPFSLSKKCSSNCSSCSGCPLFEQEYEFIIKKKEVANKKL